VYYVLRFSPLLADSPAPPLLRAADWAFGLGLPLGIASLGATALQMLPALLAAPVLIGCFAFLLLAGYPVQLALEGDSWWHCVQAAYPMQSVGMVGYIYVPATWTFAVMMFGATLHQRKVVGELPLGVVFLGLVLGTLLCTVLLQEVHIPVVSTQRLYLPCPAPPTGSWQALAAEKLDTSVLAQGALAWLRVAPATPGP